jgi:hypothetical protein
MNDTLRETHPQSKRRHFIPLPNRQPQHRHLENNASPWTEKPCPLSCPDRLLLTGAHYTLDMATILEVEKLAFDLPETQRAILAPHLLSSLPSVLHEDEGIAEALRRDAGLEASTGIAIIMGELDEGTRARRR